jgi:hypothetical protein
MVDVNCKFVPIATDADLGLMVTTSLIVIAAVPLVLASAILTASIVRPPDAGTLAGAQYTPLEDMVPAAAFPPATPFTSQVTA